MRRSIRIAALFAKMSGVGGQAALARRRFAH